MYTPRKQAGRNSHPRKPGASRSKVRILHRSWALLVGLALFLFTACSTVPPVSPDFTLALSSSALGIEPGNSDSVTVTVTGTGGFAGNVALSLEGAAGGITGTFSSTSVSASGLGVQGSSTLTLTVPPGATARSHTLTVRGTPDDASLSSKTQTLTLTVTPPPASIDTVTVQGQTGNQVRQGFGAITLEITGTNLANIALAKLGDLTGTVQTNNNVAATIDFTIPHGESIGSKDLSVTADAGTVVASSAVQVTAITANANTGSDANLGTPDSPFETLSHAASVADPGDTIDLADGTYDAANGETFPVDISGVTLSGASEAGTILDGTTTAVDGLTAASGPTSISNLTVANFTDDGIDVNAGDLTVSSVSATDNGGDGLEISGAGGTESVSLSFVTVDNSGDDGIDLNSSVDTATIDNVTVTNSSNDGIEVDGGTVTISNSQASGNDDGIELNNDAVATISDVDMSNNRFDGIDLDNDSSATITNAVTNANDDNGVEISNNATATITNLTATNNQDLGVELQSTSSGVVSISNSLIQSNGSVANESGIGALGGSPTLSVDTTTISSNAQSGIRFDTAGGSLLLRNSTIQSNGDHGIEITGTPAIVNLGDAGTSGNNTITQNTNFQLSDNRPAAQPVIITAFGVDLGGAGAPPTGTFTGATSNSNRFEIVNAGNQIDFGP